ncbi:MAG TPA: lamin tail domain-containing protein, partial [Polyangia bacterium]|nr:lamin tail domain-containing protein [Polyangia bacterium]
MGIALQLAPGISLNSVAYAISGPAGFTRSGSVDVSQSATVSATIGGLPAGTGFTIALTSADTSGSTQCMGSAPFSVTAGATTGVTVHLLCHEAPTTGSVLVNGTINQCAVVDGLSANPAEVLVGGAIALSGAGHDTDGAPAALTYHWTATAGTLSDANAQNPTFTCTTAGSVTLTLAVSDGDCGGSASATVTCTGAAHIVINEVESNGDPVGDWVELTNAGTTTADISGWKLKDDTDSHDFVVVPSGTSLAPGGFYRIYVFQTFGLGAPDMARLFDPAGNLVDSFSWTTHAVGTYGRCPDGTGPFVDSTPTPGARNACGGGAGGASGLA